MSGRRLVRLFPLPNVVLLPGTTIPLHVFEPRYRRMLADALESDRLIGMQLLKPGDARRRRRARPSSRSAARERSSTTSRCEDGRLEHPPPGRVPLPDRLRAVRRTRRTASPRSRRSGSPRCPRADGAGRTPRDLRRALADGVRRLADGVGRAAARDLPARLSDEGLVNEAIGRLGLEPEEAYQPPRDGSPRGALRVDARAHRGRPAASGFPVRRSGVPAGDPRWN